jgi:hypothetical protein
MWKSFGPYCAPAGEHTLAFTSDAQDTETTVSIIDSYGLVRGRGGMDDFPIRFNISAVRQPHSQPLPTQPLCPICMSANSP